MSDARRLAVQLRQAFAGHSRSVQRPWTVGVRALPCERPLSEVPHQAAVRVNLTLADVGALITILDDAVQARLGKKINTNEVAALIQYSPVTIRGWLKKNDPQENPFPRPMKHRGRHEWYQSEIEAWLDRQSSLKEGHQRRRAAEPR
jgi:predicted DNA-binding transcriptional regulator AlpA